jgi:hypothetical protein
VSKLERSLMQPWLQKNLPGKVIPVENPLKTGFPDLIYTIDGVTGLIELKYRHRPPSRVATNFGLKDQQALFASQWTEASGVCFLIVRIESPDQWFIIHGSRLLVDGVSRKGFLTDWLNVANYHCFGYPNVARLVEVLCQFTAPISC